ncbi:hypothetical protein F7725_023636 [Dissostichus mawsoni]|uniref:Cytochrome c oxidase assembly protein COX20, mitochondrial n=1 Tax=Dissostichus mawsoni TaxID=36200 RepID=A0A7J5XX48_DISMA|nr:hypothetical protein F7725_023636 [Dissostichus mawsoni]
MAEEEQESKKAVLHGAGGAVGAGLIHFLTTRFMLTTLGSWFYCRINNAKLRVQQRMIQEGIKNKVMYEGSVLDPTKRPAAETPPGAS